jgi:hypothetical protein
MALSAGAAGDQYNLAWPADPCRRWLPALEADDWLARSSGHPGGANVSGMTADWPLHRLRALHYA